MNMDTIIDADSKSVNALFQTDVQYQVPLYQRRYIWNNESWEVLWKDILDQASKEVSEKAKHFTGPIVTRRVKRQEMRFEVIDGQQRLMTFQLIFCVIRDLCKNLGYCKLKGIAGDHIQNGNIAIMGFLAIDPDPDPTYKFWASKYDESTFKEIKVEESEKNYGENIHLAYDKNDKVLKPDRVNEARSKVFSEGEKVSLNILDAYDYFYEKIRNHIEEGFEEDNHIDGFEEETKKKIKKKIHNLLEVIKLNFELVQITPGESQQAEEIFESVNATGRKLSEFDYLRNNLFLRASDESERFYTDYWIFEDDPDYVWNNDRLESFFQAFLIAKLGPDILKNDAKLFDVYRHNLKEKNVENEFRELKAYGETYKHLDNDNGNAYFKEQMQFYADLSTFYDNKNDYNPGIRLLNYNNIILVQAFILHLVHKTGISYQKGQEDLEQVFRVLESYTTRRLLIDTIIGRYPYQQIINYFRQISSGDLSNSEFSISELAECLGNKDKESKGSERKWIPYNEIRNAFQRSRNRHMGIQSPYFQACLRFTERYILYRIENWMRDNDGIARLNFNEFPDRLERIEYGKDRKDWSRNSLGNATFCERGRGGHAIRSFEDEKKFLRETGKELLLNQMIYNCDEWDKNEIQSREEKYLKCFQEMWPAAETFTSESATPLSKSKTIPKPKIEPKWFSMIQLPCVIVSYQEQKLREKVTFDDKSLFICSLDAWRYLNPIIETVGDVRGKQLKSTQQQSEKLNIKDEFLKLVHKEQAIVSLVTRYGYLLEGTIENTYDDVICMEIRKHRVIVFRTGLLEFATDILYEGVVEDWGPDNSFGTIKCQSIPYMPVQNIEVKSEFLDQSIVSRKLLPNVKVTFNLNIIQKNGDSHFQALEVEPVTTGELHEGTIKFFRHEKGSGMIILNDSTETIYVNRSQVPPEDRSWLQEGQQVEFNIAETVEGENSAAINVRVIR